MCVECHLSINQYGAVNFCDDEGLLHCLDGPALIWPDGSTQYWVNGMLHRDGDNPAVIWTNGTILYYRHDKLHRVRGPARIWSDGHTEHWENGERIEHV